MTRRNYTQQEKRDAIEMAHKHGLTYAEVARRIGAPSKNLSRWAKDLGIEKPNESASNKATVEELEAALKQERKRSDRLQMENDILKKAAAYFAGQSLQS